MKTGIGLLLIAPSKKILTLKELESKPQIEKEAGMISFPLETVKEGEGRNQTVIRLILEELGRTDLDIDPIFFGGRFEIVTNAYTLACYGFCQKEFEAKPLSNDVEFYGWLHLKELLGLPSIRKEVRPLIEAFMKESVARCF